MSLTAFALLLIASVFLAAGSASDETLFRQVKIDIFDENWEAVLKGCDELLARFPNSGSASQAAFYRARALSRMPRRQAEAIRAYQEFVGRQGADKLLIEEAWSGIFDLACAPGREGNAQCAAILRKGLANRSAFVSTLAAIRASDVSDESVRRKALEALKKAYETQDDLDVRNEILIAILKIDPSEVPEARLTGERTAPPPDERRRPTLIRMSVYNKVEGKFEVKVNFPIAFARMLIDSLGKFEKEALRRGAREQGVNLDDIFDTIQKAGAGRLLEVDTKESLIEIWIE